MTPDVSSVLEAGENCGLTTHFAVSEKYRKAPMAELKQAAEQACYRYALAMLEQMLIERKKVGIIAPVPFPLEREIAELQQLIAGSV